MNILSRQCKGLSLVELMVALVLGLIISGAAVQMFLASRTTYQLQDALARVQENGRFAMNYMAREVRMAGYLGCSNISSVDVNVIADFDKDGEADTEYSFDEDSFIFAIDDFESGDETSHGAVKWSNVISGTDVLYISSGSSTTIGLTGNLSPNNANVKIENNSLGFEKYDPVLITDCVAADLFLVSNNVSAGSDEEATLTHGGGVNTSSKLSKTYGEDAFVMGFEQLAFFVRDTGRTNTRGDDISALYMADEENSYELIEGVEDIQLEFGIDNGSDSAADEYVVASSVPNWRDVVSIRLSLLLRSIEGGIINADDDRAQKITFNGDDIASDTYVRQVFSSVITLRNRVP